LVLTGHEGASPSPSSPRAPRRRSWTSGTDGPSRNTRPPWRHTWRPAPGCDGRDRSQGQSQPHRRGGRLPTCALSHLLSTAGGDGGRSPRTRRWVRAPTGATAPGPCPLSRAPFARPKAVNQLGAAGTPPTPRTEAGNPFTATGHKVPPLFAKGSVTSRLPWQRRAGGHPTPVRKGRPHHPGRGRTPHATPSPAGWRRGFTKALPARGRARGEAASAGCRAGCFEATSPTSGPQKPEKRISERGALLYGFRGKHPQ
jgi:hypothetical protein